MPTRFDETDKTANIVYPETMERDDDTSRLCGFPVYRWKAEKLCKAGLVLWEGYLCSYSSSPGDLGRLLEALKNQP